MGDFSASQGVYSASGCNCCAFMFALFAAISPYWLWAYSGYGWYNTQTLAAGGAWQASSISTTVPNIGWGYSIVGQWIHYSEFNTANVCQEDSTKGSGDHIYSVYEKWAKPYGFCDGENGSYENPSTVKAIQALTLLVVIFSGFSVCAGSAAKAGGSKAMMVAAVLSGLTMIFSCACFSTFAAWDYATDIRSTSGAPMVLEAQNDNGLRYYFATENVRMHYGPAFGFMVMVFIISTFSTCIFAASGKAIDEEFGHLDGGYGAGAAEYGSGKQYV